jgi:hypothetical protein
LSSKGYYRYRVSVSSTFFGFGIRYLISDFELFGIAIGFEDFGIGWYPIPKFGGNFSRAWARLGMGWELIEFRGAKI